MGAYIWKGFYIEMFNIGYMSMLGGIQEMEGYKMIRRVLGNNNISYYWVIYLIKIRVSVVINGIEEISGYRYIEKGGVKVIALIGIEIIFGYIERKISYREGIRIGQFRRSDSRKKLGLGKIIEIKMVYLVLGGI